jgi:hypothetical protein
VKGKRRFFAPEKENREAVLRAQKNVLEQNTAEGADFSPSPNGVLRKPSRRKAAYFYRMMKLLKKPLLRGLYIP